MPQSTPFCSCPDQCLPRSASIVWNVIRQAREARHELHGAGRCRAHAPFGAAFPSASGPREVCEGVGCVDLFLDVWIPAHAAMHARFPALRAPVPDAALAYLTRSARTQASEQNRLARVARGGVARPQRCDGLVGRIAAACETPWQADLFRFLLGFVASPARTGGGSWPLDVLTRRKNLWDAGERVAGSQEARAELRADVEHCLTLVRRVAGDGWLYDCLLLPMANPTGNPLPSRDDDVLPLWTTTPDGELHAAADSALRDTLRRVAGGVEAGRALRDAVDIMLGTRARPAGWAALRDNDIALRRLAKRLLCELARTADAA